MLLQELIMILIWLEWFVVSGTHHKSAVMLADCTSAMVCTTTNHTSHSAAQKLKSWVAQRATHGESLGRPYFFWVARDFLLYALKFFCLYTCSKLG